MTHKRIDAHTLKVLEFDGVREILATFASSGLGKKAAAAIYPSVEVDWIAARMAETTEMKGLLERGIRVPLAGLQDISGLFQQVGQKQTVFEPDELLEICGTLAGSGRLKRFFSELEEEEAKHLRAMGEGLGDFDPLVEEINGCIAGDKTIRDEASARLKKIRQQLGQIGSEIQRRFKAIISAPEMRSAVENDRFLTRNGRAVVAVKANYRQRLRGVVLDRSNTGATLYIEPYALAELSNSLEDALSAEKREEWRILQELTRVVLDKRKEILSSILTLGHVDLTYAKSRFSIAYRMAAPAIRPGSFLRLREVRHPLLLHWAGRERNCEVSEVMDEIVPVTIRLGNDFDLLILTGPNTGGKTVALKTIGLLTLMAQSGMHISAWADSQIPVYRQIFADIGDEQSIQQSLSTFSAHMQQIVRIMDRADKNSLVLLDELGAGTDPGEGAALGMSILDKLLSVGGKLVATTHLDKLKVYAYSTARVENASVQFDLKTLKPTYRLMIGTPGSSNALAIAQRLGMPKAVVGKAQKLLSKETDGSSELINQVQLTREAAERNRSKTQAWLDKVKGMQVLASERLERTAQERARLMEQMDKVLNRSMREVRGLVSEFVAEMQNAPKSWSSRAKELGKRIDMVAASTPLAVRQAKFVESVRKGDRVYIMPFKCEGIVQRIHRKRQIMVLLMDGKQVEAPFAEIWEIDSDRSK